VVELDTILHSRRKWDSHILFLKNDIWILMPTLLELISFQFQIACWVFLLFNDLRMCLKQLGMLLACTMKLTIPYERQDIMG
jgi:hypothetical protein